MDFTCIKCEFKFNKMSYDLDERMCYECLYEDDDDEDDVQNYGPPYSMANPTGEPVKAHPLGAGFAHKDTKKGIQDDTEC